MAMGINVWAALWERRYFAIYSWAQTGFSISGCFLDGLSQTHIESTDCRMPTVEHIRQLAREHPDALSRAQRIYLDQPSHALEGKHATEFAIKREISEYFDVPFRHVAFTGSAHLGFSPTKGTEFSPGTSDLDVALIDARLFQKYWAVLNEATRAFNDLSGFSIHPRPREVAQTMQDMLVKRGALYHFFLPKCRISDRDASFLDGISRDHSHLFAKISIVIYMNEYAFCWKQNSALQSVLRVA